MNHVGGTGTVIEFVAVFCRSGSACNIEKLYHFIQWRNQCTFKVLLNKHDVLDAVSLIDGIEATNWDEFLKII